MVASGICSKPHHTRNELIDVSGKKNVHPLKKSERAAIRIRIAIERIRVNGFMVMYEVAYSSSEQNALILEYQPGLSGRLQASA